MGLYYKVFLLEKGSDMEDFGSWLTTQDMASGAPVSCMVFDRVPEEDMPIFWKLEEKYGCYVVMARWYTDDEKEAEKNADEVPEGEHMHV